MISTAVGYTGGVKKDPTYRALGDHTESIRIVYDPERISYADLLRVFWDSHDPSLPAWSRQYRSALFVDGEEQRRIARDSTDTEAARRGARPHTELEPVGIFWPAEDYHQKYRLRQDGLLLRELTRMYPAAERFRNSTAAARLNGFLDGWGTAKMLEEEIESYGLSAEAKLRLREIVAGHGRLRDGASCTLAR